MMERRTFAEFLGALAIAPAATAQPTTIPLPNGKGPLYAVWSGEASVVPSDGDYTVVRSPTAFLNSMAPPGHRDAGEGSILQGRVKDMQVGASDQIRTAEINVDPAGNPGVVRITRIR